MFAQSVASALLSTEAMNYGTVIAGALVLVCDIWLLLLHDTHPSEQHRYRLGRVRRLLTGYDPLNSDR
jgi:hypothetical protein